VMLVAVLIRRMLGLEDFITGRHFDILGKLLLTSSLCVGYAYLLEAFTTFYGPDAAEKRLFIDKVAGELAPIYWATIVFNVLAPQAMWRRSIRLNETLVVLISLFVIVGMWCERYVIVVMSLRRTHLPSAWGDFTPTVWDWLTLFGTIGLFIGGLLIAIRLLPTISMFEMREVILRNARRNQ
jgi:Ni/Fe-hydrogenase subunit HybB-like protein